MRRKDVLQLLLNGILNGVELEDGRVREFDALDYFALTKEDIRLFRKNVDDVLSESSKQLLKEFFKVNFGTITPKMSEVVPAGFQRDDELNALTFYPLFDEKGEIIKGTGVEITQEIKLEIFDLLDSYKTFYTMKTFSRVKQRIRHGYSIYNDDIRSNGRTM